MTTPMFETEHAPRVSLRGEALINEAFLRVIQTGSHAQVAVMTVPAGATIGSRALSETDCVYVVAEGKGEALVGNLEFGIQPGDLVLVHAGTVHDIVNRAAAALRLLAVLAPPAYPAGTLLPTRDAATADLVLASTHAG